MWLRAAIAILVASAAAAAFSGGATDSNIPDSGAPDRPPAAVRDGYAGSTACRACHAAEHATWYRSFHRSMTQPANDRTIASTWQGEHGKPPWHVRMYRKGDEFWIETPDIAGADPRADTAGRLHRRVVLVTGSHHKQVYWYGTGNGTELDVVPWVWLVQDRKWVPRDAAFMTPHHDRPRNERGNWNDACIECHTTGGRPRLDDKRRSAASDSAEHGIACEACHGEAAEHAEQRANPLSRYAAHLDPSAATDVVNPARLDAERGSEVCGRCHSARRIKADDWPRYNREGPGYRPGDDLDEHYEVIAAAAPHRPSGGREPTDMELPDEEKFWSDGTIRIAGRELNDLRESACYLRGKGDRKLGCMSCHGIHRPDAQARDDQLKPGMRGDKACTGCHADIAAEGSKHTHHPPESVGSSCMNCHMPNVAYTLLKATRTHTIRSPSAQVTKDTGRPDACTLCHLDKPLKWTAGHLRKWYGQTVPELGPDMSSVPSGLVFGLVGNALQRGITAWHMGWAPAREAAGTRWMPAVLLQQLIDPYPAVRYLAGRSLRTIAGFKDLDHDFIADRAAIAAQVAPILGRWFAARRAEHGRDGFVIVDPAAVDDKTYRRLINSRNDRPVSLAE